jgi:hypothetical protein
MSTEEGLYLEYTCPDDGSIRRMPTSLPVPSDILETLDLNTAVLVVSHAYLTKFTQEYVVNTGQTTLTSINVQIRPIQRLRYIGGGSKVERALLNPMGHNHPQVKPIEFHGVENIRNIPDNFMYFCHPLTSIDMSPFRDVTEVGHHFMFQCDSLIAIDLSPFRNVTKVGGNFLSRCVSLTSIDLSPLSNVTNMGEGFLYTTQGLSSIDLSLFRSYTTTPSYFLGSGSFTTIDLSPFSNVTEVAPHFLTYCTALTTIDLTPFANVITIGPHFMANCHSLTNLDLSPLVSLKAVDRTFMQGTQAFTPAMRKRFGQVVVDRNNSASSVPATVDVRKVDVKAGGKKKK